MKHDARSRHAIPLRLRATAIAAAALGMGAMGSIGCYATVDPQPVGYAETTAAPVDIETYPSVMYEGQPAYFYGDHWWHRDGASWSYYREEPAELHSQRDVVIHAPRRVRPAPPRPEVRGDVRGEVREERHEERR